jgi:hypothetical protein
MILYVVTSSMDYGENYNVEGVFSTPELADAFMEQQEERFGSWRYFVSSPHVVDSPGTEVE